MYDKKKTIDLKYLVFFAIFVSPMGANALSFNIGSFKMTLYRLAILLLLVLSLIKYSFRLKIKKNYYVLFLLAWLVYAVITVIWAIDFSAWFRAVFFLLIAFVSTILCIDVFKNFEDYIHALHVFLYGITFQAIIGWYEYFTWDYRFYDAEKVDYVREYLFVRGVRTPIAMLGNPNNFATLMLIGTFIGIASLIICKSRIWKTIYLVLATNCGVLIFLTNSRANIIGLLLGIGFVVLFFGYKKSFFLLLILGIVFMIPQTTAVLERLLQFDFSGSTGSDVIRLGLVRTGIDYFLDSFGFGVGAGQIEQWITTRGSYYYIGDITNLHNLWIEILTDYGLIIFVGYLVFYFKMFFNNYNRLRKHNDYRIKTISIMLCSIMFGYIIASVSSSSNLTNEWMWMFWTLCICFEELNTCPNPITSQGGNVNTRNN